MPYKKLLSKTSLFSVIAKTDRPFPCHCEALKKPWQSPYLTAKEQDYHVANAPRNDRWGVSLRTFLVIARL